MPRRTDGGADRKAAPLTPRQRKLNPSINWLFHANRLRLMGDRLGALECLRLARLMRQHGRRACAPPLP